MLKQTEVKVDYCDYHIINPAAGKGKAKEQLSMDGNLNLYHTKSVGDAERFVFEACQKNPYSRFYTYGGDGTFHEVINGILRAGAQKTAIFTPIAAGTGNDFIRTAKKIGNDFFADLLYCNGTYTLNMVNIGFDCHVADCAGKYRRHPLCFGSTAYLAGIVCTLCKKISQSLSLTYTDLDGNVHTEEGEFLLTLCANGAYCGGGFHALPCADPCDGIMDLLLVSKITRRKFLALVPAYKNGTHFTPDGTIAEKFRPYLKHIRCRQVEIVAKDILCVDGEIERAETVHISIVPNALHVVLNEKGE